MCPRGSFTASAAVNLVPTQSSSLVPDPRNKLSFQRLPRGSERAQTAETELAHVDSDTSAASRQHSVVNYHEGPYRSPSKTPSQ